MFSKFSGAGRRLSVGLFVSALVAGLVACGGGGDPAPTAADTSSSSSSSSSSSGAGSSSSSSSSGAGSSSSSSSSGAGSSSSSSSGGSACATTTSKATATCWHEEFTGIANKTAFLGTAYSAQLNGTDPLYVSLTNVTDAAADWTSGTNMLITSGSGTRLGVGIAGNNIANTTPTTNQGGMFAFSGKTTCTMVVNVVALPLAGGSNKFEVYIDNTTTTAANSVLSVAGNTADRPVSATVGAANTANNGINVGLNTYTWSSVGDPIHGDFLQIRWSGTPTGFSTDSIELDCN